MNVKKVLLFVDDYSGGAGNVIQLLANSLYQKGEFIPVVILLNPHTQCYKLDVGIQVIESLLAKNRTKNKLLFLKRNLKDIRNIIDEQSPDCIISFLDNINTQVCLAAYCSKIPIIVSERSNPIAIAPEGMWRYLRTFAYRRANKIAVQCSCFKNFIPSLVHKTFVAPNPVIKPKYLKYSYLSYDGLIRIISCARLVEIKQFDKMIEAFDISYRKYDNLRLTIYGEGPERENLEKLIVDKELQDVVSLPGVSRNVHAVLRQSDIYLMTSSQEGFPNALCEAMAVGLPVVAFMPHEGLRDIVNDGYNGFLVAPGDVNMMAERLEQLATNQSLREKIGLNAKSIADNFSIDVIRDLWEGVMSSLIKENC